MQKIPKGYKETKIGVVPKDWEVVKLGDIAERIVEKNINNNIKIVFSNSASNGIVMQDEYFDKNIANKNNLKSYYVVNNEDFVYNPRISKYAPAGPINKNRTGLTGLVSPLYTVFRINKKLVNNYFEYYFHSNIWLKYMKGIANYGARHDRMNITNKDFMNMPINFPPLQEQKKIAQILSTWDRAIEKQEKLIEAKEKLKKGLMQRLLMGEVRFKEFGSGTLVLQNGGVKTPLPSGWKEVRLGEVLKEINEKSKIENEYNILSSTIDNIEIRKGRANSKTNIGYKILKINQLVLSPQNLWLGNININTKFKTGLVSPSYKIFDIKNNKLLVYYAKYLFKTGKMLFQYKLCSEMGASIVRRNLNLNLFFLIKLKLPPLTEQQKIAQVLSTADREIELLKKELEELKKQKKGLMQRLLSGEVRVKV